MYFVPDDVQMASINGDACAASDGAGINTSSAAANRISLTSAFPI